MQEEGAERMDEADLSFTGQGAQLKLISISNSTGKPIRCLRMRGHLIRSMLGVGQLKLLHTLDLSSNRITAIEDVFELSALRELRLCNNYIAAIPSGIARCAALALLDLRDNRVDGVTCINPLRELFGMHTLVLAGNPVAAAQHYRDYILVKMPRITTLDDSPILQEERETALRRINAARLATPHIFTPKGSFRLSPNGGSPRAFFRSSPRSLGPSPLGARAKSFFATPPQQLGPGSPQLARKSPASAHASPDAAPLLQLGAPRRSPAAAADGPAPRRGQATGPATAGSAATAPGALLADLRPTLDRLAATQCTIHTWDAYRVQAQRALRAATVASMAVLAEVVLRPAAAAQPSGGVAAEADAEERKGPDPPSYKALSDAEEELEVEAEQEVRWLCRAITKLVSS